MIALWGWFPSQDYTWRSFCDRLYCINRRWLVLGPRFPAGFAVLFIWQLKWRRRKLGPKDTGYTVGSKKQLIWSLFQRFFITCVGKWRTSVVFIQKLWVYTEPLFWTEQRSAEAGIHPLSQAPSFAKVGQKSILQEAVAEAADCWDFWFCLPATQNPVGVALNLWHWISFWRWHWALYLQSWFLSHRLPTVELVLATSTHYWRCCKGLALLLTSSLGRIYVY